MRNIDAIRKRIRVILLLFMLSLLLSGVTAFAVESELYWLTSIWHAPDSILYQWLYDTYISVKTTNDAFPQIAYGFDWLAFAHIILAVLFIGPLIDPVKNIWVIQFGCIACVMLFPVALIAGHIRQIPFFWQLIDCSFGAIGLIPLVITYKKTRILEAILTCDTDPYNSNHKHSIQQPININ